MCKCLYCYQELDRGMKDFHPSCARKIFGTAEVPEMPYTRDNMSELAKQVIRTSASVTGVQAKMSLDVNKGGKNEPARFTIVGLWGKYIFKPQSSRYANLPELEDLTMKMAEAAGIHTAQHALIRLNDGELGYITKRLDRDAKGRKISMLDMCQLTNRLTEHKYFGTYGQLANTVKKYSSAPMLDVQRFWEVVLFSWITGNSDMHCKNFSLLDTGGREYVFSPAYDLLAVLLADHTDTEEMAMAFTVDGPKSGFDGGTFLSAMEESGIKADTASKMIRRMASHLEEWENLIDSSFLPHKTKAEYKLLLQDRLSKL